MVKVVERLGDYLEGISIRRFIRYFFVGGMASIVDYSFANLVHFILSHSINGTNELLVQNISGVSGVLVGLVANYFIALKIVFNAEKNLKDFLQICVITGVSCLLTSGLIVLNVAIFHVPFALFKIVTMGIAFIWNYLARSLWVYKDEK